GTVEVYNPASNSWSTVAGLPTARTQPAGVSVNGHVYAVGGSNGNGLGTVEALNLGSDSVATFASHVLTLGRHSITAVYGGDASFNGSASAPYVQIVAPDRFEPDDTRASAANIGVGPGVHLTNLGITPGDQDWYHFEVLRPDSIDVRIAF